MILEVLLSMLASVSSALIRNSSKEENSLVLNDWSLRIKVKKVSIIFVVSFCTTKK